MDFTIIIVTHNRAELLSDTVEALRQIAYTGAWELLIVDNASSDQTAAVVERAGADYPVPLRYLYVPQPGKYGALNAGIAAAEGTFIAATDDDAYPASDWLERAADGLAEFSCDFVGGPVYPVWDGTPPAWVDARAPITGKVLGLQDHGSAIREYGRDGLSWPLGVNVAYRRAIFDRVGMFDARLGRRAGTLRNQAQREWHLRARAAGARGMYLPRMLVHHRVAADRLTRRYFHRWFYWHGISRAILSQTTGVDLLEPEGESTPPRRGSVLGLPVPLWRRAVRSGISAGWRRLTGQSDDAVQYELMLSFCAGVLRQRVRGWTDAVRARIRRPREAPESAAPSGTHI